MNRITVENTPCFMVLDVWQTLSYLKLEVPKVPKITLFVLKESP